MFKTSTSDSTTSANPSDLNHSCMSEAFDDWVDLTDALTVQMELLASGDTSARPEAKRLVRALKDKTKGTLCQN